jgi:putative transcriptional regulator
MEGHDLVWFLPFLARDGFGSVKVAGRERHGGIAMHRELYRETGMKKNRIQRALTKHLLTGQLLVATDCHEPSGPLARAVCLIAEDGERGTVGLALNRSVASDLRELWSQLAQGGESTSKPPDRIYLGGPLNGPMVAVHDDATSADGGNGLGLFFSAQAETLRRLVASPPGRCRLVVGCFRWQKGVLEEEIADSKWLVAPAIPEVVFEDERLMWGRALQLAGNLQWHRITGIQQFPNDPHLN